MNEQATVSKLDPELTRQVQEMFFMIEEKSPVPNRPVLFDLIDKDGLWIGTYEQALIAANVARRLWPDQDQDEERKGFGWDVQAVGAK